MRLISRGVSLLLLCLAQIACQANPHPLLDRLRVEHPTPTRWQTLEPGLAFTTLRFTHLEDKRDIEIVALKADPRLFRIQVLCAASLLGQPGAWLPELHQAAGALASVNGGFFQPNMQPTGLLIAEGRVLHELNPHGGSGVFLVREGKPEIIWTKDYAGIDPQVRYALQAGPLLVEPGKKFGIKKDQHHPEARSALCLRGNGEVILLSTVRTSSAQEPRGGLDLYELAHVLYAEEERGGLECQTALNLDGGTSTHFQLTHAALHIEVPGKTRINNAVAVLPK